MRKFAITHIAILGMLLQVQGQEGISGTWLTHEENSKVEIYEKDGLYFGKIVGLERTTDKWGNTITDRKNPDKSKRNRPLLGIETLTGLEYEDGVWKGKLYIPKKGWTADVELRQDRAEELELRVSIMGRTRTLVWTRSS